MPSLRSQEFGDVIKNDTPTHFQNFSRVLIGFQTSLAKCLPVILKLNMIEINPSFFFFLHKFCPFLNLFSPFMYLCIY